MTVLTTTSTVSYQGNGATKSFDFAFKSPAGALVITITAADGTESTPDEGTYTVTGYDDANGGTVTFASAPAVGVTVTLARQVDLLQAVALSTGGAFYAEVIEAGLDRLTMVDQQLHAALARAVKVPVGLDSTPEELLDELLGTRDAAALSAAAAAAAETVAAAHALALGKVAYLGVSSITELRESHDVDEVIAFVRGYSELSDMGGGVFHKDTTDTTSADDGGCIIIDAVGQRWKRSFKYVVRPEWFGAKGDGVQDDSVAFQRALDAISPPTITPGGGDAAIKGGGCLVLSSRTYVISSTLKIGPYTCIEGDGLSPWQNTHGGPSPDASKGPVLLWDGADTEGVLHAVPYVVATGARFTDDDYSEPLTDADAAANGGDYTVCQGVSVRNIGIYAPNGAKFGLRLSLCPTARVDGLSTYNCNYSMMGEANWESGIKNCVLTAFDVGYFGSSGQHAIHLDNCWFHGGRGNTSAIGVRLDFSAGVVITAPSLEDLATGVFCTNSEGLTVLGGQCERVFNLLKCDNSRGVRWIGGDLYNPAAGGTWDGSYVFDGYSCEAVIDGLQVDHPNYPEGGQTYPGKWLGPTIDGNTVNLTVRGNLPRAGDGIPSPSAGAIVFDVGTERRSYLGGAEAGKNDLLYKGGAFVSNIERSPNGEIHFTGSSGQQIVTMVEDGEAQVGLNQHLTRWVYFYNASGAGPSTPLGANNSGSFAFNNANGDMWIFGPAGWKKAITYSAL